MDRTLTRLILLLCIPVIAGCTGSRWAKRDPAYSDKYSHHTDNPVRTVKQAFDARHLAGRSGMYSHVAAGSDPAALDVSAGSFIYGHNSAGMIEGRMGLKGLASIEDSGGLAGGIELGVRAQTPTRLAPFVGTSIFAGYSTDNDPDDDNDLLRSFDDEDRESFAIGIAPEAGAHFWITPEWRLTGSVSHQFVHFDEAESTSDFTTYGLSLSYLWIPYRPKPKHLPITCTEPIILDESSYPLPSSDTSSQESIKVNSIYSDLLLSE